MIKAYYVGRYQDTRVHRYTVEVRMHSLLEAHVMQTHAVLSTSPAEAMHEVRQSREFLTLLRDVMHPLELVTQGPKGGLRTQFLGWESVIGTAMQTCVCNPAGDLFKEVA